MTERTASDEPAETSDSPPRVRIRYWAAAKAAAGVADEVVEAGTVAEALAVARRRHAREPQFDKVLSICSFLLGEAPVGGRDLADLAVSDGDVLDVLPPFAGGAARGHLAFREGWLRPIRSRSLTSMESAYLTRRRAVDHCHTSTALCQEA